MRWLNNIALLLIAVVLLGTAVVFYQPFTRWLTWWKIEREGQIAIEQKRYTTAMELYREGTKKYPNDTVFPLRLAFVYQKKGRVNDALRLYREGMQRNKKPPLQARLNYARLLQTQNDWNSAVDQYREALHTYGPKALTFYELGRFYVKTGKVAQEKGYPQTKGFQLRTAIYYLDLALKEDEHYYPARYVLGEAHQAREEWQQAMAAFCKLTEAQPQHSDAWYQLGYSLSQLGYVDPGAELMQYAISLAQSKAEQETGYDKAYRHHQTLKDHYQLLRQSKARASSKTPQILPNSFGKDVPHRCLIPPAQADGT